MNLCRALVDYAPIILSRTPCHLSTVAAILESLGTATVEVATAQLLELAASFPHTFIVEKEGAYGYFLVFYFVEGIESLLSPQKPRAAESFADWLQQPFTTEFESLASRFWTSIEKPTALERLAIDHWKSRLAETPITEICDSDSYEACVQASHGTPACSGKIHLESVIMPHTDRLLGDCSYLDTCFKGRQCRFVHYRIRYPKHSSMMAAPVASTEPAQCISANLLTLDLSLLGNNWDALIVDPPWDIHTNPNYDGGCSDAEFQNLRIDLLQQKGVIFLWVTGRVLDFGRRCLKKWGYTHVEEVIWLKVNQLMRTICTGRTGHWLNHTKEHVLVGYKGSNLPGKKVDTDVLVSTALGKLQKPEELYSIIDRLVGPSARKLELFGRKNNIRAGWLTVGNETGGTRVTDPALRERLASQHPL